MTEDVLYSFEDSSIIRSSVRRMLEKGTNPLACQYSTNMINLEEYIGDGLHAGYLYVIDGPESIGKTAFMLSLLHNIGILSAGPGVFFSLENSIDHIIRHMLVMKSSLGILKCFENNGKDASKKDFNDLREAADVLSSFNINLTDACGMTDPIDIIPRLYQIKRKISPSAVFIDGLDRYLRTQSEAKSVARALSNSAENLDIPVLVSCRLKQTVRKRRGYEPLPCDYYWPELIREADVVLDLYRPSYYDSHASGNDARVRIMKNIGSKCGTAFMHYDQDHLCWGN